MKILKKIIVTIMVTIVSLLLVYNLYSFVSIKIFKKDLPTVAGYAALNVVSGSMEPTILVGDTIIINTKVDQYNPNDIVTFYDVNGSFVTHRIIKIEDGQMVTKGDNNNTEDEKTDLNKIVGKYEFKINHLGQFLTALKNPLVLGLILILGTLVCIFISTNEEEQEIETEKNANNEKKIFARPKQKMAPTKNLVNTLKFDTKMVQMSEVLKDMEQQCEIYNKQLKILKELKKLEEQSGVYKKDLKTLQEIRDGISKQVEEIQKENTLYKEKLYEKSRKEKRQMKEELVRTTNLLNILDTKMFQISYDIKDIEDQCDLYNKELQVLKDLHVLEEKCETYKRELQALKEKRENIFTQIEMIETEHSLPKAEEKIKFKKEKKKKKKEEKRNLEFEEL